MDEHGQARTDRDEQERAGASVPVRGRSVSSSVLVANAVLSLLNLCCHLLDRQLIAQAQAFENEGGFTERLYRIRKQRKRSS